ncbi:MAG: hypothetical protein LAO08_18480 [Acidobacteriia bacterium]|nr:hypothetical protein [Terriglobia bacterium]
MAHVLKPGSKGLIPLNQWKLSPEFAACTAKQQAFLLALIETQDFTKAVLAAYGSKNARQAQIFSYAVREVASVKAALNVYLGKSPLDVLYEEVVSNLKHAEPGSVAASRFLAQKERLLLGLAPAKDDDEVETPRPATDSRIPTGAMPLVDSSGVVRGYRTADGQYVQLANVEVTR